MLQVSEQAGCQSQFFSLSQTQETVVTIPELFYLCRLVKRLVDAGDASHRGLVYQALASAITDVQLTEYYRFLAMLQSLSMNGELTKRRLHCWLEEPARRMQLLAELLCRCEGLKVRICWVCLAHFLGV